MTGDVRDEKAKTLRRQKAFAWALPFAWGVLAARLWTRTFPGFEARVIVVALLGATALTAAARAAWADTPGAGPSRAYATTRRVAVACWVASWPGGPWWVVAAFAVVIGVLEARHANACERALGALALGGALAVGWNAWRFGPPPLRVFFTATCVVLAAAARGRSGHETAR